jgi:hypothetical protein
LIPCPQWGLDVHADAPEHSGAPVTVVGPLDGASGGAAVITCTGGGTLSDRVATRSYEFAQEFLILLEAGKHRFVRIKLVVRRGRSEMANYPIDTYRLKLFDS